MGISCTLDMCQEIMEHIFSGIMDAECFINNIGAFSDSWDEHLTLLKKILDKLKDNGFMVNPLKCEWAVKETDWLVCRLTPVCLEPWKNKTQGIINIERPQNIKQL